jgi:iron complex outermembrane receptor protein
MGAQINTPNSQTEIQSYYDVTKDIDFDGAVYFVGANKEQATGSYTKLDLRLGYRPTKTLEISFGGNNLLQNHYDQSGSSFGGSAFEAEREFYSTVSWKL